MRVNTYPWEVLMTVVEQGSFLKAARALHLSTSAVSHMVSKLEEECGYSLLIRSRSSVALTVNGQLLLPYVQNLLKTGDALEQELRSLKESSSGMVRIAASNTATKLWLPDILLRFRKKHPNVKVVVMQSGDLSIREWIEQGEVDLAISKSVLGDVNLRNYPSFIPLHRTQMVCIAPRDYVPERGDRLSSADFQKMPVILQLEGYDTEAMEFLRRNGVEADSDFRIETDGTCHTLVERGFGLCVTSALAAQCNPSDTRLYPLEPPISITIGLLTVYPDFISPAAQSLRKEILGYMMDEGWMNV